MAHESADSGLVSVNTEDSVLSGKVRYLNKDCLLLLSSRALICRAFASDESAHGMGAWMGIPRMARALSC